MHDPRYLEGIRLFNERRWFEAHEVWEDLWRADPSGGRAFWQGLIMAAVALEHWRRGNPRGACSQWRQGRARLVPFRPRHAGLDVEGFIVRMDRVLAPVLARQPDEWGQGDRAPPFDEAGAPRIVLS